VISVASALAVALHLIVVHSANGTDISVNIDSITSLRSRPIGGDSIFTEYVHCMISMSDGKFVAVVEDCETVRRLSEEAK
jgi:hypothetical protein